MVILLQSAGGQEIKVSVGRMMCQAGFINSEIEDSCLGHYSTGGNYSSLLEMDMCTNTVTNDPVS